MTAVLQVVGTLLFVYSLLLSLRIILTWFGGSAYGRAWGLLCRVTDPYLALFRGIAFLRQGMFDFTPLAAILVLVVLQNVVATVAVYGVLRFGIVTGIMLQAVWGSAVWILWFFLILAVVRFVGLYVGRNPGHSFWQTIDLMIRPVAVRVSRLFGGRLDYSYSLVVTVGLLLVVWLAGGAVVNLAVRGLTLLPF